MGYTVKLEDDYGELLDVPRHAEGSVVATNIHGEIGTEQSVVSVTQNYRGWFLHALDKTDGLYWLNGKKAEDTIVRLDQAIDQLGIVRDPDYWKPTEGNAGCILHLLLLWAIKYPEGTWVVFS